MKIKLLIVISVILCAGAWIWYDLNAAPQSALTRAHVKDPMPDITFQDLDGKFFELSDFKGRTVLLNVWATWCPPCIKEFPDLLHIAQQRSDDLVLIALSVDTQADKIKPFFARFDEEMRSVLQQDNVFIAHDPTMEIALGILKSARYPETFVIAPDGGLERKIAGVLTSDDIRSLLAQD